LKAVQNLDAISTFNWVFKDVQLKIPHQINM